MNKIESNTTRLWFLWFTMFLVLSVNLWNLCSNFEKSVATLNSFTSISKTAIKNHRQFRWNSIFADFFVAQIHQDFKRIMRFGQFPFTNSVAWISAKKNWQKTDKTTEKSHPHAKSMRKSLDEISWDNAKKLARLINIYMHFSTKKNGAKSGFSFSIISISDSLPFSHPFFQ